MAAIKLDINATIGKLHDVAIDEIKNIGKSWLGAIINSPGAVLQNTGVSTYDGKSSQFRGGKGPHTIRVYKLGNMLTRASDKNIIKMVKAYFEYFTGDNNVNVSNLIVKKATAGDLSLKGVDPERVIEWWEIEYSINYKDVAPAISSADLAALAKLFAQEDKKADKKDKKADKDNDADADAIEGDSEKAPTGKPTSDGKIDGFDADTGIEVASLQTMYNRAKMVNENKFFESKPFTKKSRELILEFQE